MPRRGTFKRAVRDDCRPLPNVAAFRAICLYALPGE